MEVFRSANFFSTRPKSESSEVSSDELAKAAPDALTVDDPDDEPPVKIDEEGKILRTAPAALALAIRLPTLVKVLLSCRP